MLENVNQTDLPDRISDLSDTIAYLEGKLSDVDDNPYQLSILTYALTLAQSNQASAFLTALEATQQSEGNYLTGYLRLLWLHLQYSAVFSVL